MWRNTDRYREGETQTGVDGDKQTLILAEIQTDKPTLRHRKRYREIQTDTMGL